MAYAMTGSAVVLLSRTWIDRHRFAVVTEIDSDLPGIETRAVVHSRQRKEV
jgi:hypothetical protein